jgi:predicted dehydrogenase
MTPTEPTRRSFIMRAAAGAAGLAAARPVRAVGKPIGANDRINVAVIGCGVRGKGSHMADLIKLAKSQNVAITAVCDVWQPALRGAEAVVSKAFGSKPFTTTNYEDLLTRDDVDAVTIATPDHAHAPMLTAACKAGKDAYCEKPMTVRLDDAKDALKAARDNKRVVQIGTQRRSDGLQRAWAEFFQAGRLGKVTKVEIGYHDSRPRWRREFSDVAEKDVDWKRYLMYLPDRPFDPKRFRRWQLYKDYTLGPVSLLGSHYIDIVIWYLSAKIPTSGVQLGGAYIWGDDGREHPDTCDSLWEYPEGFLLLYTNHFGNSYNDGGIAIYGTNGTYVNGQVLPDGAANGKTQFPKAFKVVPKPDDNHMRNWLECIRSRKETNAPVEAGYHHSVATVLAAESLWRGRRMVYDPQTLSVREG